MLIKVQMVGQIEYCPALKLQKELVGKRIMDEIPDNLLFLEHPHTYTIGIDGHREHLLLSSEDLRRLNIACYEVDRSGWDELKIGPARIGNVGVNINRYQITSHGFSTNVNPDLAYKVEPIVRLDRLTHW